MKTEIVSIIATTLTSIAAMIITYALSVKGIRNANKRAQLQAENFFIAEYTKRYQNIILSMPDEVFEGTAVINGTTLKYLQLYFDLCNEEYYIYHKRLIPDPVWDNWMEGMRITTKLQLYQQGWKRLSGIYNQDFFHFFEHEIINHK